MKSGLLAARALCLLGADAAAIAAAAGDGNSSGGGRHGNVVVDGIVWIDESASA